MVLTAAGNLTQYTDRRGEVSKYQYDHLSRRTFAGFNWNGSSYESTINYTWDGGNRLHIVADSIAGTITDAYDGLNRLQQEVTPQGTVAYTYDGANRRQTMQVTLAGTGQTTVNYGYGFDNGNHLTSISQSAKSVGLSYDGSNRRTCLTLPNGVIASYGYDQDSRVTSIRYGTGGSCSNPPSTPGRRSGYRQTRRPASVMAVPSASGRSAPRHRPRSD
jgi:YD repeat-containing protein